MRRMAVVGLLIATGLALPGTAAADPTGGGPGDDQTRAAGGPAVTVGLGDADATAMRTQTAAVTAADGLRAAVSGLTGFTGIELDGAGVVLRWQGQPPAAADAALTAARGAVGVRVVSARYARADLTTAASALIKEIEAGRGNGVHTVTVLADGSGLRLGVDPPAAVAAGAGPDPAQVAAAARTAQQAGTSVATTVAVQPRISSFSRENDFPPWAGGAVVVNRQSGSQYNGRACTSGWGMKSPTGHGYLITASHCGELGDLFRDPTGESIGRVTVRDHDRDIELIMPTSSAGEIYVGGPIGAAQAIKGVAGWSHPYVNESICQSGAYSGNICGLVVDVAEDYKCDVEPNGRWKCWGPLLRATRTSGGLAGRPGDSGGPLYYAFGSRVMALGTVTGGDNGAELWFVAIDAGLGEWGMTMLTRSY